MSPQALAALVHQRLLNHVDPDFRTGQQRFFQHEVDSYGVRTVNLNAVIREVYREVKPWPVPQRDAFIKLMWETGKLEPGALVCHVYRRFGRSCGEAEFRLFERWLDRYVHNWAHTDGVSSWLLSACIANQPDLRLELMPWTESRNRWKRRASAVALLQEAKHGRHTEFIFNIASRLLPDRDDMVEKGVGWLLKETYPARPGETLAFLLDSRNAASRLTLRYAAEKMTPAHRRELLSS